jgi:hypothetical protein
MIRSVRGAFVLGMLALSAASMVLHSPPASAQAAAQAAQVGGSWNTEWGGGQAVLDLIQIGAEINGAYDGTSQGKVAGTLAGQVLTGTWTGTAPGDGGGFVLSFSADGKRFSGTWGSGSSRTDGGAWVGTRK